MSWNHCRSIYIYIIIHVYVRINMYRYRGRNTEKPPPTGHPKLGLSEDFFNPWFDRYSKPPEKLQMTCKESSVRLRKSHKTQETCSSEHVLAKVKTLWLILLALGHHCPSTEDQKSSSPTSWYISVIPSHTWRPLPSRHGVVWKCGPQKSDGWSYPLVN
jgi:hypothetical protein